MLPRYNPMTREGAQLWVSFVLRLYLTGEGIVAIFLQNWTVLLVSFLALLITFIPSFITRNWRIHFPVEYETLLVLFAFTAFFLGEVYSFYYRVVWWDILMHAFAGLALGFLGFLIVYVTYRRGKIDASPFIYSVFAFSFSMAVGVIWEIFEYFMDSNFGTNMLKSGLRDTMWDLIVNSGAALVVATYGYFYIKRQIKGGIWHDLVSKFIKKNSHLK